MLWQLILFTAGFFLVLKGGDLFVGSSAAIARKLNIPRIIIGGTIVSLATTAPEFVVSTTASYLGDSGIALGNALGSAIANIGLIVSITAIIAPISVDLVPFKRRTIWMLLTTLVVFIFAWNLHISRWGGLFLFIAALVYLALNFIKAMSERKKSPASIVETPEEKNETFGKSVFFFAIGTLVVIVGSQLLVKSSIAIAEALKIPTFIIGLTVVAVGTSLPELVTAVTSARKKVADLSISNIIGANILNLSLITGVSAMIRPLTLDLFTRHYAFLWVFIMIVGMMFIFWKTGKMTRRAGIIMLGLYVLYLIGLIIYTLAHQA